VTDPAAAVARRALHGAAALGVRQVVVQGANLAGSTLLARLLAPDAFGQVAIATFVLAFAVSLSGLGLGASLVRQPEEPDASDCRAVLTLGLWVAGGLALAALTVAVMLGGARVEAWLLGCGALALLAAPFQALPVALLERRLAFASVARIEAAQALAYNGVAVALASLGLGVVSIAPALLARAATGAVLAQHASALRVAPGGRLAGIGRHLRFGLPLLGSSVVGYAKDAFVPVLIGATAGAAAVGLVGWAQLVAAAPSLTLMILARLYLPAFARLQHERGALGDAVARALRASHALVAPLAVLTAALIEPITRLVFGVQWLPALPVFRLLWVANLFAPTSVVLLAVLAATGRARQSLGIGLAWAAGTWLLGVPLVLAWGPLGFGAANVAVQAVIVLLIRAARRDVAVRVLPAAVPPWAVALLMGAAVRALDTAVPATDLLGLGGHVAWGLALYASGIAALDAIERPRRAAMPVGEHV
jgi:PST family polysaccharide transporter